MMRPDWFHPLNVIRRIGVTWLPALVLIVPLAGCSEAPSPDHTSAPDSAPRGAAPQGSGPPISTASRDEASTGAAAGGSGIAAKVPLKPAANGGERTATWLPAKVKFKSGDGETLLSIKPKDDGAKLVDGDEQELARFTVSGDKVKVKDVEDKVIGYVVAGAGRLKVEDASQEEILFKLIRQDDGDWKLEDGAETLIYKIKRRDYGWEVELPDEKRFRKVKVDGAKVSLRNAEEKTLFATKDSVKPLAVACLGLEAIEDVRMRSALLVAVQRRSP